VAGEEDTDFCLVVTALFPGLSLSSPAGDVAGFVAVVT